MMLGVHPLRFVSSQVCHGGNEGIKPFASSELLSTFGYQGWDIYPKGIFSAVVDAPPVAPQVYVSLCLGDKPKRSSLLSGVSHQLSSSEFLLHGL
ncbi:MAG: hypothetical protein RL326_1091 [Pseudomonadota bacterium]